MHALALLSPINESDELSPYRTRFAYKRFPGQRSPISPGRDPFHNVRDTVVDSRPDTTMDDLWIYDCYASDDTTSPGGYPRSPSTPSHNRSISLPATTANYVPPNNIPLIREPTPHRPPSLNVPPPYSYVIGQDTARPLPEIPVKVVDYTELDVPAIDTAVFASAEFSEYSPLEQEVLTIWEVTEQLAAAADAFSRLDVSLTYVPPNALPPDMDEDIAFWFIEALNLFVSDCKEVAKDLANFSEFVEALATAEQDQLHPPVPTLSRASFSERDMKEVLQSAANLPQEEVAEALAALEVSIPLVSQGKGRSRDRPPSLKLSTSDTVLLQAQLPRSRTQSVGAVGRFVEKDNPKEKGEGEVLKKHRAYVLYGDETPVEDDWSAKSIVDYDSADRPEGDEEQQAVTAPRSRPISGQSAMPRPLSSPVTFSTGKSIARRPPSLALSDPHSPRSTHSTSSSVSSLFSNLPRSSYTTASSPRLSPRQSISFDKGSRFPTSSGNFKKMFTNIFKKKEKEGSPRASIRSFGKRSAGVGSVDATLLSASSATMTGRDPFAASPPSTAGLPPQSAVSDLSMLDGYSETEAP